MIGSWMLRRAAAVVEGFEDFSEEDAVIGKERVTASFGLEMPTSYWQGLMSLASRKRAFGWIRFQPKLLFCLGSVLGESFNLGQASRRGWQFPNRESQRYVSQLEGPFCGEKEGVYGRGVLFAYRFFGMARRSLRGGECWLLVWLLCIRPRTRELDTPDLLEQLPALQQLLFRLLACQPEGAAVYNKLIQYALSILAGECVKLYGAITNGILNLVDKYFEMQKHDAVRALEIYQKAGNQAEKLSEFFEICRGLDFGRVQFVKIEQPPATFMTAMEEYVKDTPCTLACQPITYPTNDVKVNLKKNAIREDNRVSDQKQDFDVEEILDPSLTSPEPPRSDQIEAAAKLQVTELLDLDELIQEASELDEKNALGVAIFTSENPSNSANGLNLSCQTTGWELALVTAPSSSGAAVAESKLAGGMDKLTLDSLYDDAIAGRANQNRTYHMGQLGSNPFELANSTRDPFYASSNIAPSTNVEMAGITQQEEGLMMQQQQYRQPLIGEDPTNPFGNPFVEPGIPSHFK
ncbi:putative clathrin assembly protein [Vitis vinifera]|uniref:Putative clathrin assembly protein n=1 Tax=Vitis vinifera TaxID=29760 RepID=A0A438HV99_VITVI|nr:putative clathrin assembly protein [Vitis vinifera]